MKYLKKFESFYENIKELEEICMQYLTNLTDNNYEVSFSDRDKNYFEIIIEPSEDNEGYLYHFIDIDSIKDDIITLIEYLTKTTELKYDTMEINFSDGFTSYLYSNKIDRIISGEDIRNVIHIKDSILKVSITFRIGI